jgi:hypothetical protein
LSTASIAEISRCPSFNRFGWKILDRWALNSPEKLKALEAGSLFRLMTRALDQQFLERKILDTPEASEQMRTGLAEHEILALHEVNTEL